MKIAVASGKGGTGKTAFSLALFQSLTGHGNTVLIDADVEEPDCSLFLQTRVTKTVEITLPVVRIDDRKCKFSGECAKICRFGALAVIPGKKVMVFDDMCIGCGACVIGCPNRAIYEIKRPQGHVEFAETPAGTLITGRMRVGVHSPVRIIDNALRSVPKDADTVIIDSPPGAADAMMHAVRDADYVVLVTEPTRFGTHDVGVVITALLDLGKRIGVVINKAGIGDGGIKKMLTEKNIDLLLEIPFSREAAETLARGELLTDIFKDLPDKLLQLFERIQEKI